jgi:DNA-binding PadR family transcriptional regulator
MSSVRLYILGALDRVGPMHGHQIRREAQTNRAELWTDVKVGSLYSALGRMAAEGIIEAVRTEKAGNLPDRQELDALRAATLRDVRLKPDPVDLALQYGDGLGREKLMATFTQRRAAIKAELDGWRLLQEQAAKYLQGTEWLCTEHTRIRLEAELAWHDQVLAELPKSTEDKT